MSEAFEKFGRLLDSGVRNLSQSFYDHYVEANAKFRSKAGLKVTIVREALGECCDWCSDLAGIYSYDNAPDDIYARHRDCNCIVSTKTEKGTWQDAWNKKEYNTYRENRIARAEELEGYQISSFQRKNLETVLQDGGFAKKPENLQGNYDDFTPLHVSKTERELLNELKEMSDVDGFEHGLIIRKNGEKQFCHSNNANAVEIPISSIDEKGLKLYHSHTNDTPHSIADLSRLLEEKVDEVGVVTRNGDAFTVSVGNGWVPSEDEFRSTVKKIAQEVDRDIMLEPGFFDLSIEERNYVAIREQTFRVCREFEWELCGGPLQ